MADYFKYTPAIGNTAVSTSPIRANVQPNLQTSNAINSILNLVGAGAKAYGVYKTEEQRSSLTDATLEANKATSWFNETINTTDDAYEKQSILDQYTAALVSIGDAHNLDPKYREVFDSSHNRFIGEQQRQISSKIYERKISDHTVASAENAQGLVNATIDELIPVIKNDIEGYKTIGMGQNQANEAGFNVYAGTFLNNITDNPEAFQYTDITAIETKLDTMLRAIDPKLIGKDVDLKLRTSLTKLKKGQKSLATSKLNDFLVSEATTVDQFNTEADKYSSVFTPLEIKNFKESKANRAYTLKVTQKTRLDAATKENNEVFDGIYTQFKQDMTVSNDEVTSMHQKARNRGYFKSDEEMNLAIKNHIAKLDSTKETANSKLRAEQKKIAAGDIAKLEQLTNLKDAPDYQSVENTVMIASGGIPTSKHLKFLNNYQAQYAIDNNASVRVQLLNTTSSAYLGTPIEEGTIRGLNNMTNEFYNTQNFSASGIIKTYKNHNLKGSIPTFMKNEVANPETALQGVMKFNGMINVDRASTQKMLGDDLFNQMVALSTQITMKDGKPFLAPDSWRDVKKIANNPEAYPVDLTDFDAAVIEQPNLFPYKEEYKSAVRFGQDPEAVLEGLQSKIQKQTPVPGIQLNSYPHNLNKDDISTMEILPEFLGKINPSFVGFAYNPSEQKFYYSTATDQFSEPIEEYDANGNIQAFTKLEGADGVLNYLTTKAKNYYYSDPEVLVPQSEIDRRRREYLNSPQYQIAEANRERFYGFLKKIGEVSDFVKSFNPIYDAESDSYLFTDTQKNEWRAKHGKAIPEDTWLDRGIDYLKQRWADSGLQAAEISETNFVNNQIDIVFKSEGGFQNDVEDRGNYVNGKLIGTNLGITPKALAEYRGVPASSITTQDMKNLKKDEARKIYSMNFYEKPKIDKLPDALQPQVFDMYITSGNNAVKILQRLGGTEVDGWIGSKTVGAAKNITPEQYKQARIQYYKDLAKRRPVLKKYLNGWIVRANKY